MWLPVMVGIKRKASVALCMKAESSAGAVQSMKLLQEFLLMTENDGPKFFFAQFLGCCTASAWSTEVLNPSLYEAGYGLDRSKVTSTQTIHWLRHVTCSHLCILVHTITNLN